MILMVDQQLDPILALKAMTSFFRTVTLSDSMS